MKSDTDDIDVHFTEVAGLSFLSIARANISSLEQPLEVLLRYAPRSCQARGTILSFLPGTALTIKGVSRYDALRPIV